MRYNYPMLTWNEIETRAIAFQRKWRTSPGTEKQDDIKFIQDFLHVFGVDWQTGFPQHQIILPSKKIKSNKPPGRSSLPVSAIPKPASPTSTTSSPCPPTCAKPTRQTTKPSGKPTPNPGTPSPPNPPASPF